jgi:hypothetical protein
VDELTDGAGAPAATPAPGQAQPGAGQDAAVLYVLACPLPGTDGGPAYLLHQVGGVDCVLGYTDLARLVDCCGPHQPWLAIRLTGLMADLRDQHLTGPVVNLPLSPEARWSAEGPPVDLAALATAGRAPSEARGSEGRP